jgi:hypothetical protein
MTTAFLPVTCSNNFILDAASLAEGRGGGQARSTALGASPDFATLFPSDFCSRFVVRPETAQSLYRLSKWRNHRKSGRGVVKRLLNRLLTELALSTH